MLAIGGEVKDNFMRALIEKHISVLQGHRVDFYRGLRFFAEAELLLRACLN